MFTLILPMTPCGKVVVYDNAVLGSYCGILSGATVGEGGVFTTGSVVIKNVPPYSLAPSMVTKVRGVYCKV